MIMAVLIFLLQNDTHSTLLNLDWALWAGICCYKQEDRYNCDTYSTVVQVICVFPFPSTS